MTCCDDHDHGGGLVDLADGEDGQTETFHMCGDDCTCGHGLASEDGDVV